MSSTIRTAGLGAALAASMIVAVPGSPGAQSAWNGFDAAAPAGVNPPTPAWGLAFMPAQSGAGYDLWVNNHANTSGIIRNIGRPGQTYVSTSTFAGQEPSDTHGVASGDLNGDGLEDVLEVSGAQQGFGSGPNQLWLRNPDGSFTKTPAGNLEYPGGPSRTPVMFDLGNDGDLDVLVTALDRQDGNTDWPSAVLRNDGSNNWTVLTNPNVSWLNYGTLTSLAPAGPNYVVGTNAANFGVHTFDPRVSDTLTKTSGVLGSYASSQIRGVVFGDFDGDLRPEVALSRAAEADDLDLRAILLDIGPGGTVGATDWIPAQNETSDCWANAAGDFDNDGDLDLFYGCTDAGHGRTSNQLLINDGEGRFTASPLAGLGSGTAEVAAVADVDGDGFLDVYVGNGHDAEVAGDAFYHNGGGTNRWIEIDLTPSAGVNRQAIGAEVYVYSASHGWQARQVAHATHVAQDARTAHVGLSTDTTVEATMVVWPDGTITSHPSMASNQRVTLTQAGGTPISKAQFDAALTSGPTTPTPPPPPPAACATVGECLAQSRFAGSSGRDGSLVRFYAAAFLRIPDDAGWAYWTSGVVPFPDVMWAFLNSTEFRQRYANISDDQFVELMYLNVLGRENPQATDPAGFAYWKGVVSARSAGRSDVFWGFAESTEFRNKTSTS